MRKRCPVCGYISTSDDDFCAEDGTRLINDEATTTVPTPDSNTPLSAQPENTYRWALPVIAILGIAVLIMGYLLLNNRQKPETSHADNTNSLTVKNVQMANSQTSNSQVDSSTPQVSGSPGEQISVNSGVAANRQSSPSLANSKAVDKYTVQGDGSGRGDHEDDDPGTRAETDRLTPPVPKQISGGVLNGKATSLPKPSYPATARAVGASGSVSVQVLVDENGNVISASAVSGHALLKPAAVSAARGAKFMPTKLSGQPVKVSGVITYNFVP